MNDILAFIEARLTEEETDARAATQEPWTLPWRGAPFIQFGDRVGAILTQDGRGAVDPPDVAWSVRTQQPRSRGSQPCGHWCPA